MNKHVDWTIVRSAEKIVRQIIGHLDECERSNTILDSSRWFYTPTMDIYVRAPIRWTGKIQEWDVCLSNIQVNPENVGQGLLTAVLDQLESRYTVKIENVLEQRLAKHLLDKRGYTMIADTQSIDDSIASYVKRNETNAVGRHRVA